MNDVVFLDDKRKKTSLVKDLKSSMRLKVKVSEIRPVSYKRAHCRRHIDCWWKGDALELKKI